MATAQRSANGLSRAQVMNIAIIGGWGGIATALITALEKEHSISWLGKNEFDFLSKTSVSALADRAHNADIIIYCTDAFDTPDTWDMFTINTVSLTFLLEQLVRKHSSNAHVIVIGSHLGMWSSWPGINLARLAYNLSKECLQSIIFGLAQCDNIGLKLSILNPSKIQTKMHSYQGYPLDCIVESIQTIINSKASLLVVEYNNFKQ